MIKQLNFNKKQINYFELGNYDLLDNHKVGDSTPIYARLNTK
jgi:hypothetical protein